MNWSGTGRSAAPTFPSGIAITSSTRVLRSRRRTPAIVARSQGHVRDSFLTVVSWRWRLLRPNLHNSFCVLRIAEVLRLLASPITKHEVLVVPGFAVCPVDNRKDSGENFPRVDLLSNILARCDHHIAKRWFEESWEIFLTHNLRVVIWLAEISRKV